MTIIKLVAKAVARGKIHLIYAALRAASNHGAAAQLGQEDRKWVFARDGVPGLLDQREPVAVVQRLGPARIGEQDLHGDPPDLGAPEASGRIHDRPTAATVGVVCIAITDLIFAPAETAEQIVAFVQRRQVSVEPGDLSQKPLALREQIIALAMKMVAFGRGGGKQTA